MHYAISTFLDCFDVALSETLLSCKMLHASMLKKFIL